MNTISRAMPARKIQDQVRPHAKLQVLSPSYLQQSCKADSVRWLAASLGVTRVFPVNVQAVEPKPSEVADGVVDKFYHGRV